VCDYSPKLTGAEVYYLILESIAAANKPTPNPAIRLPTKYKADCCRKKNPTPRPNKKPPSIAHVVLSDLLLTYSLFLPPMFKNVAKR
jgi:hypothetical protein